MKFRWTMKELQEFSSKHLILALIAERKSNLNPYTPLSERLTKLEKYVEQLPDN